MLRCTEMQGETELLRFFMLDPFKERALISSHPRAALQVGNMKKETTALWYKDKREIKADEHLGFTEGVLKLEIAQVRVQEQKPV